MSHPRPAVRPLEPRDAPSAVAAGDFDNDGLADLAVLLPDTVFVYRGTPDPNAGFTAPELAAEVTGATDVAAADFNADGNLDLAVAGTAGVSLLLGGGDGTFSRSATRRTGLDVADLVAADLDGDGRTDVAVAGAAAAGSRVTVLLGGGAGLFRGYNLTFAVGDGATALAVGDLDGDDRPDVITANQGGTLSVLSDPGGGSAAAATFAVSPFPTAVLAADLSGDGAADLAVTDGATARVTVLINDGAGGFGRRAEYRTGPGSGALAAGDFTADGVTDLAVLNGVTPTVSLYAGLGGGAFDDPVIALLPGVPFGFAAVADPSGAGDALAVMTGAGAVLVRARGTAFVPAPQDPGSAAALVAAADAVLPGGAGPDPAAFTLVPGLAIDLLLGDTDLSPAQLRDLLGAGVFRGLDPAALGPAAAILETRFGQFSLSNPTTPVVQTGPAAAVQGRFGDSGRAGVPELVVEKAAGSGRAGAGEAAAEVEEAGDAAALEEARATDRVPELPIDLTPGRPVPVLQASPDRPLFPVPVLADGPAGSPTAALPADAPARWGWAAAAALLGLAGRRRRPAGEAPVNPRRPS